MGILSGLKQAAKLAAEISEAHVPARTKELVEMPITSTVRPIPPRVPPKTPEQIEAIAQRVAPQLIGEEFVRAPKGTTSVAGKSQKQFALEKELQHRIIASKDLPPVNPVDLEKYKGNLMLSLPGDFTLSDADIFDIAGNPLRSPSRQYGGPRYGLGQEGDVGWASSDEAAKTFQNRVNKTSEQYGDVPVLANYMTMAPEGLNFAQHFSDAALKSIDPSKMKPEMVQAFNDMVRAGYPGKKGQPQVTFPNFAGIENPDEAYKQMAQNTALRKHFNALVQQPTMESQLGMPSGMNIRHAVTEPELRNLEPGMTGYSLLEMNPTTTHLQPSEHPTYSHDIPGQFAGRLETLAPYELMFPDTIQSLYESGKTPSTLFRSLSLGGGRQLIDNQLLDEIGQYNDAIKRLTGRKKGGSVDLTPEERVAMHQEAEKHFGIGGFALKAAKDLAEPVDRLAMGFKDVTQRTPALQVAAQALDRGELTAAQYAELVKQHKPVTPYTSVPTPATPEAAVDALTGPKKAMYGKTAEIPAGAKTDLRLDIPAYANHGVWVNSVHQANKPTVYGPTSAATNVTMKAPANKALAVAKGGPKAPFATMSGEWNPMTAEEAYARAQEVIDHPEWSQIGFDPERHGFFYDRETMEPVTHADEVIQVGPLVLARGAKHIPPEEGHKYGAGGIVLKAAENLSKLFHAAPEAAKAAQEAKVAAYVDPATQKIGDWAWRDLPSVHKDVGLTEVPDYIQGGYGQFMKDQNARATAGQMNPRDFVKAYTVTRSSVNRGGLSHASATRTGMKLPNTGELVRPEGAYAEWLGSKMGQKYLDEAEQGNVHMPSIYDLVSKFEPFGMAPKLGEDMVWAAQSGQSAIPDVNSLVTAPVDEYRDMIQSVPGIGPAKSGFVASLLGRGDLPTFDARQIRLHTGEGGKEAAKYMSRGKGLGGDEAVDRLAARQQAMDLNIDPELLPFYQHLVHHGVWDKVAGSETTHDDLIRAMRGYAEGGAVEGSK
jgi:hypothetical protein